MTLPGRVLFGTATWNYPGWRGIVYPETSREKMSSAQRLGLYAACGRFETVEADFPFYRPQGAAEWRRYARSLPGGFPVVTKVWEEITCEVFPKVERQGSRAGEANPLYLDAEAFRSRVLIPWEEGFSGNAGPFVFEFRKDWRESPERGKRFVEDLDGFLCALPKGPRYAIEVRTASYRGPALVAMLRSHGATPVLNWWTHMPPLSEQFAVEGMAECDFLLARLLVAPGRAYGDAVKLFSPYDRLKEEHPQMRRDAAAIARFARDAGKELFLIVNNRAEGCAPYTIDAIRKMI